MDRVSHAKLSLSSTLMTRREHSCDLYWEWGLKTDAEANPMYCTEQLRPYLRSLCREDAVIFMEVTSLSHRCIVIVRHVCHHYILALNSFLCLNPLLVTL